MRSSRIGAACLWAAAIVIAAAGTVGAQTDRGRIEGIVKDATAAVVPGATVELTSLSTGVAITTQTDGEGAYVFAGIRPGTYKVRVTLDGFRPVETPEVTVAVTQVVRLDYTLSAGSLAEEVTVVGQSTLIDRVTSSIGLVIDEQQVKELPLNGRNFTQLATLTPGVNRGTPGSSADGSSGGTETFRYGDTGGAALSVNGVREQFNNYLLDGVDNNESLVNTVSIFPPVEGVQEFRVVTSGANAEFGRAGGAVVNVVTKGGTNAFHGSAYEFLRDDALDAKPEFQDKKLPFYRHQFGGSLGGPIRQNRAFFFGEYAGLRENLPTEVGRRVTVPTERMRNGDFSELLNPAFTGVNAPIVIYDPKTGQPFPGNVIPRSRLNPTAVNYLNFYPLPDFTDRAQQNYASRRERDSTFHNFTGRLDYVLSDRANLFGRVSFGDEDRFDPGFIPGAQAGFGSGTAANRSVGTAFGYNRVLSSAWVTEVRAGINNQEYEFLPVGYGENLNQALGIGGPGGVNNANGISLIGGGDGRYIEYLGDFGQYIIPQRTYQLSGSVTALRGDHTMKAGALLIRRRVSSERSQFGKGFYFFPDVVSTPGNPPPAGRTGYEVAEMLIGRTDFTITGFPEFPRRNTLSWENSAYVQDDWRVSDRVTLNLGLRYDVFTPYYEADDQLANFDRDARRLVVAGASGVSRSTVDTDWNNFGPRVGFAYQLNSETVLRGAYGLFYTLDRGGIDNQLIENPPFVASVFRGSGDSGGSVSLDQQIPLPPRPDPANPQRRGFDRVISANPNNRTSNVHQFNASVQREIAPGAALLVAYVGTRGRNLTTSFGGPNLDNVTFLDNSGTSEYNALQLTLRQVARGGLTYLASYTLSKAENDAPGLFPGPLASIQGTELGVDPGPADFDRRHQFSLAATYELPLGRDLKGVAGVLAGGWQLNSILTFQSGTPFNVFCNGRRAAVSGDSEGPGTREQWFNTGAFSCAPDAASGHSRNLLYGPGVSTVDLSLFKDFRVTGDQRLELRLEFFNLLNKNQYIISDSTRQAGSSTFGRLTQTRLNSQFQTQVALRYVF